MKRSTKKIDQTGNDRSNVPISEHASMIELKKLVAKLSPDRQQALDELLDQGEPESAVQLLTEAAEAITEGINLMVMASLDGYMPQNWEPLRDRINIFLESQGASDDEDS
ncbi:MAG: hypothetical protein WBG50_05990 [Desulfomonilaceae bacterium]